MRKLDMRKGFVFTVIAMALLSYLVLSVSMWAQVMAAREANVPQKYKADSLRLLIGEINEAKANQFAQRAGMYALYRLGEHTVTEGGLDYSTGTNPDTANFSRNLNQSMYELITTGYTEGGTTNWNTPLNYSDEEGYTLAGWIGTINDTANALRLVVEMDGPYNFSFNQTTPWEMQVSYRMNVSARDMEDTMRFEKELNVTATIQLEGYVDPMIARESYRSLLPSGNYSQRQVRQMTEWAGDAGSWEPEPIDVAPEYIADGTNGIGWFYGPINTSLHAPETAEEAAAMNQSILYAAGWGDEILAVAPFYGAVIIGDEPSTTSASVIGGACNYTRNTQTGCLNCMAWNDDCVGSCAGVCGRYTVYLNQYDRPYIAGVGNGWHYSGMRGVLIDNEYSNWGSDWNNEQGYHRLWDIEKLRDMAVCGLYVLNPDAPSYTQRLMENAPLLRGGNYGIETFVVGRWAGGSYDQDNDGNSRVDHVFYGNSPGGVPVKGMPGCKNEEMCTDDAAVRESVGHFRIDEGHSYENDDYAYGVCGIWFGDECSNVARPRAD